ncbi:uncharacterized protein LOC108110584 [Drosophila eugracilis]|uniref:uncharacterized protein LOC108110584 n=1 Tax=Drosophila eugracilis TaxID=29029 RepID=UPI001BDA061D|nr:uncharacterized protein LOC108110584 [Drosophila eugracilis]
MSIFTTTMIDMSRPVRQKLQNIRPSKAEGFDARSKTKQRKSSGCIPPYPHSSRLKNGSRVYEYIKPREQDCRAKLWREAYEILQPEHKKPAIAKELKGKEGVKTLIHPCLHKVKGHIEPETNNNCPQCWRAILSVKVFKDTAG